MELSHQSSCEHLLDLILLKHHKSCHLIILKAAPTVFFFIIVAPHVLLLHVSYIQRTSVFNIVNTNFYFKLIFHDMLSKLVEHLFFSPSGRNQNFPMAVEYLW